VLVGLHKTIHGVEGLLSTMNAVKPHTTSPEGIVVRGCLMDFIALQVRPSIPRQSAA
jgi:hypothetical protein